MKRTFTLLFVVFVSINLLAQTTIITIRPGAEGKNSILESINPTLNRADHPNFSTTAWTVSLSTAKIRSLIEFDLSAIPAGANIVEAKLNLYYVPLGSTQHSNTSGSNESYLQRVTQSWNKSTVTWNNQPTTTNSNEVALPNSISPTQDYLGVDVSQLVRDMIQFGNYGFMLKLATEQYYRNLTFASGDYADNTKHPALIVKYTAVSGTPPAAVTNFAGVEESPLNIKLTWTDNASNEANYIIEQSTENPTNFQEVSTLPANSSMSTISNGISNKKRYFFRVKAVDANGYYSYSNIISVITGGISIGDGDKTVCSTYHFDSGVNNPYRSLENFTQTLTPATPGKRIKFTLNSLSLTAGDILSVYDGSSTSATKIIELNNSSSIPADPIMATNNEGKLTLKFTSDDDVLKAQGWEAYVSCESPLNAPHNITVNQIAGSSLELNWADTIASETGFEIQRSVNGSTFTTITTAQANATSYVDNNIFSGIEYTYRIRTRSAGVISAWSGGVSITTQGPVAPTALTATSASLTSISLTWTDNSSNEEKFILERALTPNSVDFTLLAELPENTVSYTDAGLTTGTAYYYRIKAITGVYSSSYVSSSALAGGVIMNNSTASICGYYLLDPGGLGDYSNSENKVMVLTPSESDKKVKLTFNSFNTEDNDFLYIYDGPNTSSPLIDKISGSKTTPFSCNATNSDGTLTLLFTSNIYSVRSGFNALVSCISMPEKPSALEKISATRNSITIKWTDNSTNEAKFQIFGAATVDGTYSLLGEVGADVLEYTNIGLKSGTTYFYKVRADNDDAPSAFSDVLEAKTEGLTVPIITSLSSPDNSTITINWQDNELNETGYKVERSLEANGNYTEVGTAAANAVSFNDNTAQFGTTYYYRVYAVNATDDSDKSNVMYFVAGSVIMGNTEVVRCNYIVFDSGNSLGDYANSESKVMVLKPSEAGKKVKITFNSFNTEENYDFLYIYDGPNTSSPLIDKISGSKTVPFSYYANNGDGVITVRFTSDGMVVKSGFQISVSCILVPNAPSGLEKIASTNNSITLKWTDNSTTEAKFEVFRSLTAGGTYSKVGEVGADVTEFTNNGLASGTKYYYKVRATNDDASSLFTDVVEANTTGLAAPIVTSLSSPNSQTIIVNWQDKEVNETNYKIERSLEANANFTEVGVVAANTTTFNDNTVQYGTTYYYRVYAVSGTDESDRSNSMYFVAGSVIMSNTEVVRCNYIIFDSGNSQGNYSNSENLTMVLTPASADESVMLSFESFSTEQSYDYLYVYNGSSTGATLINRFHGNQTINPIKATNATGQLTLRFISNSTNNSGGFKIIASCFYRLATPTGLTAQGASNNSVVLSWNDNTNYEHGYNIYRSLSANGEYLLVGSVGENIKTYTDENLAVETTYHYKVKAWRDDNLSEFSNSTSSIIPGVKAPSGLTATAVGENSIMINWIDNSSVETGYRIERSLSESTGFEPLMSVGQNSTNYIDFGTVGTTYYYRIIAVSSGIESAPSNTASVKAGYVGVFNGVSDGCNYFLLDSGGEQNYANNENKTITLIAQTPEQKVKLVFQSFDLENNYDFLYIYNGQTVNDPLIGRYTGTTLPDSVWATNSTGALTLRFVTDFSDVRSGFVAKVSCTYIPQGPTNLALVSATDKTIEIRWSSTETAISEFLVYRSLNQSSNYQLITRLSRLTLSYRDENLDAETKYYYKVFSSYYGHISVNSANLSTETTGCKAPSDLTIEATPTNSAMLRWADNSTNETGFTIERSLQSNSGFEVIATVGSNVTTFTDPNLDGDKTYFYRVKAIRNSEVSSYTPIVSVLIGVELIGSDEIIRCNYTLLDNGGLGNYLNSTTSWGTLTPSETGKTIKLKVKEFSLETNFDYLTIYDGSAASYPIVGSYTGTTIPDSLWATNSNGKLYVQLSSDATINSSGFKIYVGCVDQLAAPSNLVQLIATKEALVNLQWADNSQNEIGFKVYRSTQNSTTGFVEVANLGVNSTNFIDNNTENGKTYYYKVQAFNREISSSYSNTLTAVAGPNAINDEKWFNDINLYPNPTRDIAMLSFNSPIMGNVKVEIFSVVGSLLSTTTYEKLAVSFTERVEVEHLTKGLYFVKVSLDNKTVTIKLNRN